MKLRISIRLRYLCLCLLLFFDGRRFLLTWARELRAPVEDKYQWESLVAWVGIGKNVRALAAELRVLRALAQCRLVFAAWFL
jgi:hypothetical protein